MLKWQLYGLLNIRSWLGWRIYHLYLVTAGKRIKTKQSDSPFESRLPFLRQKLEPRDQWFVFLLLFNEAETRHFWFVCFQPREEDQPRHRRTRQNPINDPRTSQKQEKHEKRQKRCQASHFCVRRKLSESLPWWSFSWWTHVTESTERQMRIQCKVFAFVHW